MIWTLRLEDALVEAEIVGVARKMLSEWERAAAARRYDADLSEAETADPLAGRALARSRWMSTPGAGSDWPRRRQPRTRCGGRQGGGGDQATQRLVRQALEESVRAPPAPEPDLGQLAAACRAMRGCRRGGHGRVGLLLRQDWSVVVVSLPFARAGRTGRAPELVPRT